MPDGYVNVRRAEPSGRLHYSAGVDVEDEDAYLGDYFTPSLSNGNLNVWYTFTGDSFTYLAFSRTNGGSSEVYVDGVLIDTVSHEYPFAQQPLSFHYTGFSDGPHVVRVKNVNSMRVDAFASNPDSFANLQPQVEWMESDRSGGGSIWGGLHVPVAVGDVTGDGSIELVVASSNIDNNGELFLMRGDGSDTGDGDPIIWSIPYNIFNGFEDVGAPTIAELDGEPGAEIIHATVEGVYAYHSDGSTYWMTDTLQSHVFFAAPAVGNLDLDTEPEIVINLSDSLVVFEADGTVAWEVPTVGTPSMPILADLTNDGLLDILFHNDNNLYLYDYNYGSPALAWTQPFTMPLGAYGAPAVADIDGLQPGGDPGPEIGITSEGRLHVLDADGSFLQTITLDDGNPGGVSVADIDGDGEIEMVTTMQFNDGRIYAVNPDGSILWDVEALDNSPLTASVMDLEGDGVYEVAWNGATGGFTLFNGADGAVLFNDDHPLVISKTGSDYPVFADVDLDGYAEVVVASQAGVRVFGFDTVWGPARPLWNQHSYHITNINDDLSVPQSEANSWEVHNTYRTQTPLSNPMPSHDIVLTHTVGLTDLTVLTDTFSVSPDLLADPVYGWDYQQTGADPVVTRTFQTRLENLVTGESRMVAQGTEVYYTLPGGSNQITLPPLYVDIPHLVGIDPAVQSVGAGATAVFTVTVSNPGASTTAYSLSMVGVPSEWVTLPESVNVPGGSSVEVSLVVNVPPGASARIYDLSVGVSDGLGGEDQATAILEVLGQLLAISVDPAQQEAPTGTVLTYTLTISNYEGLQRTYDLTATGLAEVTLPTTINVGGGGVETLSFTAEAVTAGDNPFNVIASTSSAADEAFAIATGLGISQVGISFDPPIKTGGPGMATVFAVTVSNLGDQVETYDLAAEVPTGWSYALLRSGANGPPVEPAGGRRGYLFSVRSTRILGARGRHHQGRQPQHRTGCGPAGHERRKNRIRVHRQPGAVTPARRGGRGTIDCAGGAARGHGDHRPCCGTRTVRPNQPPGLLERDRETRPDATRRCRGTCHRPPGTGGHRQPGRRTRHRPGDGQRRRHPYRCAPAGPHERTGHRRTPGQTRTGQLRWRRAPGTGLLPAGGSRQRLCAGGRAPGPGLFIWMRWLHPLILAQRPYFEFVVCAPHEE